MKILYILQYFPVYGGGETVTVRLANELASRGHELFVAYTIDKYLTPMPYEVSPAIKTRKFAHLTAPYKENDLQELRNYIVSNNIEIAINQWADKKMCYDATRGTGCKLIKCYHVSTFYPLIPTNRLKKLLVNSIKPLWATYCHKKQLKMHKSNYEHCDKYVFLTKYAEEELYEEFKFDKSRVSHVPNPATYDVWMKRNEIKQKKHKVIFVGRLIEDNKRISYILQAWKLLSNNNQLSDWELNIIGEGPDKQIYLDMIEKESIPNCHLLGFHSPEKYYDESSILLMASYIEGWGMVIVEGMQRGVVPIVTDSFSAARAIITSGEDGIIVENNNLEQYASAIKNLMDNQEMREKMAERCISSSKRFSLPAVVDRWEVLFNELKHL